ncbi:MAG: winged helix-turn-helix transcriptional regulator [Firmicutes bacterium]|nr:winged helix-turn-helix transcriptional regulator [Bacillota bacterium]
MRLNNPDLSLEELSKLANISKSGMNHRLRKLKQIADSL